MSNTLNIVVLNCQRINHPDDKTVAVIASDSYGDAVLTFDDIGQLKDCYQTEDDLVRAVLLTPAFEGGAIVNTDGTYYLEAISAINVDGYPVDI